MKVSQLLIITAVFLASCDTPSPESNADIDKMFEPWNKETTAGAAVGVIKNGKVLYTKGYGMAQLEYGIPITPSSIFHIASESKQYTDFCIVLLQQQGKLSFDDDIRKYLPEVPDFGKKITIKNLIYHTSGLRDQWQLLAISGTTLEDVIHQEHVVKLVSRQKELNFEPGSRHLYCNTGYTLLAEIVKRISGRSLRQFADSAIFKPLGMTSTHFHDDYTEIVRNRTYSYDSLDNGRMANSVLSYSTVGATSLFTTVEDELKWLNNYMTGQVGGKAAIDQMYEQAVLNDGRKISYAFALNIGEYKGHRRMGHGGSDAGYRTYAMHFPDEKLGVVVFSNLGNFQPWNNAFKVADLYLPKKDEEKKSESASKVGFSPSTFDAYKGSYVMEEGRTADIYTEDGKYYVRLWGKEEITPLSDSTFSIWGGAATLIFTKPVNGKSPSFQIRESEDTSTFLHYEPKDLTPTDRTRYVGVYESDELDTKYEVVVVNDKLVLRHIKYKDVPLSQTLPGMFSCPHWWMENLIFSKDSNGVINGFEVNSGRVLHLKFHKL